MSKHEQIQLDIFSISAPDKVPHCYLFIEQGLRLHLDYSGSGGRKKHRGSGRVELASMDAWTAAFNLVAAGAALAAGLGMITYLRRCA